MSCLCDQCAALCCRYFALPIETPTTRKDFDDIRWYLCHENVAVFIEEKTWYVAVMNKCKHLQKDNRCGIYETRPKICRGYSTENCDYHGGDYGFEKLFTSAEQLWEYAQEQLKNARLKKKKKQGRKAATARRKPRLRITAEALANGRANGASSHNGQAGRNGNGIALPILNR